MKQLEFFNVTVSDEYNRELIKTECVAGYGLATYLAHEYARMNKLMFHSQPRLVKVRKEGTTEDLYMELHESVIAELEGT